MFFQMATVSATVYFYPVFETHQHESQTRMGQQSHLSEWQTRNEARHAQDARAQQQKSFATAQPHIQSLYELKDSCFYQGCTTYFKTSPGNHFSQVTQVHHLKHLITKTEPMIRSKVHIRSKILSRLEGETFKDEYFLDAQPNTIWQSLTVAEKAVQPLKKNSITPKVRSKYLYFFCCID
jgi:hypothetical protein